MAAATFKANLKINQGATYKDEWTWSTGEEPDIEPVDLTGCTARAQFRPSADSTTELLDMTTENGRIILGGALGTVQILIDSDTTTSFTWTEGVYDLEIVHPSGTVRRLMQGSVTISPEVTR